MNPTANSSRKEAQSAVIKQIEAGRLAINRTLLEFGIDAGVPGQGAILVAGRAFVLYRIARGRGVRIANVERLLPELTDALRPVWRDDELPVRLREGRAILEVPHPAPAPLPLAVDDLQLDEGQMLVGRSWVRSGVQRERVTLDRTFGHVGVFAQTRGGKSTLLRTMVASLALNTAPDACRLVLIDAKREDFAPLADLPHVKRYAWRPDEMAQAIRWAHGEMVQRIEGKAPSDSVLVVAIDEAAKLLEDAPEIEQELRQLAGQGAGANIHLILATQHPTSKALGKDDGSLVKANLTLRLVGSVVDANAAQLATGRAGSGAHLLPVRSGAFLWVEGQRMTRIQTHLQDLSETRRLAAQIRRRWGGPAGQGGRSADPEPGPSQPPPLSMPARAKEKALTGLTALQQQRALDVARYFLCEGLTSNELGHNEKVRRAYGAGLLNTPTRGGSNSRVIRAVDRLLAEVLP